MQNESTSSHPRHSDLWAKFLGLFLVALGSIILTMVIYITWNDTTLWGKDIALIFFGSRTGERIDLEIGMKVIYYLVIGLALLPTGLFIFRKKRHALVMHSDPRSAHARDVCDAQHQKQRESYPTLHRKESSRFYRCPNRECKRVFQKLAELKDLSETPARVYPACPHCGTNLEPVLASFVEEKSRLRAKTSLQQKKSEMRIEDLSMKIETRNPEIAEQAESSYEKSSKPTEAVKSQVAVENRGQLWIAAEPAIPLSEPREEPFTLLKTRKESHPPLKTIKKGASNIEAKRAGDCLEGCPNFFGYLESLPNGTVVPPRCYSCPRRVDCYMRVRAIVSIYIEQVPTNDY